MEMLDFVMGVGFAFVLEGLIWSLFPGQIIRVVEELAQRDINGLRYVGLGSLSLGIAIIWFVITNRVTP